MLVGLFGYRQAAAQGLGLCMIVPSSLVAMGAYTHAGVVDWQLGIPLAIGGLSTISRGVALAQRLPDRKLRGIFLVFLMITVVLMLPKGWGVTTPTRPGARQNAPAKRHKPAELGRCLRALRVDGIHVGRGKAPVRQHFNQLARAQMRAISRWSAAKCRGRPAPGQRGAAVVGGQPASDFDRHLLAGAAELPVAIRLIVSRMTMH